MKNPYKVPMAQYLMHRLHRLSHQHISPAIHKAFGMWYCDSCHAYHFGNVIAYELDYSDCYEDFTICHKGLKCLNIDITRQPVKSYSPTLKSVLITGEQAAAVFGEAEGTPCSTNC